MQLYVSNEDFKCRVLIQEMEFSVLASDASKGQLHWIWDDYQKFQPLLWYNINLWNCAKLVILYSISYYMEIFNLPHSAEWMFAAHWQTPWCIQGVQGNIIEVFEPILLNFFNPIFTHFEGNIPTDRAGGAFISVGVFIHHYTVYCVTKRFQTSTLTSFTGLITPAILGKCLTWTSLEPWFSWRCHPPPLIQEGGNMWCLHLWQNYLFWW